MLRSLVVAGLLYASVAAAQDGGPPEHAEGCFVAKKLVGYFAGEPMWVDSQNRLIALTPTIGAPTPMCFTTDGGVLQPRTPQPYLLEGVSVGAGQTVGARAGRDTFIVYQPDGKIYRAGCAITSVPLGNYVAPAGLAPPANEVVPVDSLSALHYVVPGGIAKLTLTPSISASLVVSLEDVRASVGLEPSDGGADYLIIGALTMTATDQLFFLVSHVAADPALPRPVWIMRRDPAGPLAVLWSTTGTANVGSGAYDPAADRVFIDGPQAALGTTLRRLLAVVPPSLPPRGASRRLLFPSRPNFFPGGSISQTPEPLIRLVGGSSGVFAVAGSWLYSLKVDPAIADFDHDGLRASQEAKLGTSDYFADSDGDGVDDNWELTQTLTSPTDAGSVLSEPFADDIVLAPSLMANTWYATVVMAISKSTIGAPSHSWGPYTCAQGLCLDSDFKQLPNTSSSGEYRFPLPEPGAPASDLVAHVYDGTRWSARKLINGAEDPFPIVHPELPRGYTFGLVPIDATSGLMMDPVVGLGFSGALWRVSTGANQPFAVIDASRKGCEILSGPADLSRCGADPELSTPDIREIDIMAFDPKLRMVLVRVVTADAQLILGVDGTRVTLLADLTLETEGFDVRTLVPMTGAGSSGYLAFSGSSAAPATVATLRLDSMFKRVESKQPYLGTSLNPGLGIFFKHGYLAKKATEYLIEPTPPGVAKCGATGGIFTCEGAGTQLPRYLLYDWLSEYIPVGSSVEKGEVISWSPKRYLATVGVKIRDPLTGLAADPDRLDWILWRTTPLGATFEWLRAPQFVALLSATDKQAVAAAPLGAISAIGISADGLKICLAEPAAGRVWELALDPATRALAAITLGSSTPAVGCAYDDSGALATLGGNPASIRIGAKSVSVPAVTAPLGLLRAGGRWIVQADHQPAACVDDSGTLSNAKVSLTAISTAPGGLAYIENTGKGYTNTVERFCAGALPSERLVEAWFGVWSRLYFPDFTFRPVNAWRGSLAVRPDGMALAAMTEQESAGRAAGNVQTTPNVLFYFFPRYEVVDLALPEHEGFRIEQEAHDLIATEPTLVTAMALVPGALPTRDWGYLKRPGTPAPYLGPPAPDAGSGPPVPPAPNPKKGCGCDASGLTAPLALLVALRLRRAERRRGR